MQAATQGGQGSLISEILGTLARATLNRRKTELEATAQNLVGKSFSLAAPAEVSNVLFVTLHLPPPAGAKRFKNGTFSTKVPSLICHPIV